ncbi:hypothetical protein Tsubulata_042317 [Turnera subulata]|uniref:ABC transporter domain-containing protein n=1 Tax=Turnera subulata TaxID=218843 RepID=A0A9Q0F6N9_9ROSI|nr:hypothetical protein Tsubulata_042317 [Turnera subulata]
MDDGEIARASGRQGSRRGMSRSINSGIISRASRRLEQVFSGGRHSGRSVNAEKDEEALKWAAIEKLPTYERLRTSIMISMSEQNDDEFQGNKKVYNEVDVSKLHMEDRQKFIHKVFKVAEEDNGMVGIQLPTVEVRFADLNVEADCLVGSRALPTLLNVVLDIAESGLGLLGISLSQRRKLKVLDNVSGIIKPSRMVLLLGPPSSGKTTLLLALAGRLDPSLKVSGDITYNGYRFNEFVPRKTSAYVSQIDVHTGEMTVKETLDFSARCLGVGTRYDLLSELARREKSAGILPEAEVDFFMKATAVDGIESSLITDYTLRASDNVTPLGIAVLQDIGVFTESKWYWIGVASLLGFVIVFNIVFTFALAYLNPLGKSRAIISEERADNMEGHQRDSQSQQRQRERAREGSYSSSSSSSEVIGIATKKGSALPFTALAMSFEKVSYYVDMPPNFVDEVMELVELDNLKEALVGIPGVTGLSTEQRKRLTIAVELVANPSIIFMDEPTSGLDARAAAIVMRTVRNTAETGRAVVCTIHQPSIDIFEAFDELLLMKRGGELIYSGPLGQNSQEMIQYFEAIPGAPKIQRNYNPATWMLEVTSLATEIQLGVDFAELYKSSPVYQSNEARVKELSTPPAGAQELHFPTKYSQPMLGQFKVCLWKQWWAYWRNPDYNLVRLAFTLASALIMGTIYWDIGNQGNDVTNLRSLLGGFFAAVMFVGVNNLSTVQPVVSFERAVFYREKAAGMYSPIPYALACVTCEIPYVLVQSTCFALIMYAMMAFEWAADKFFWFYFVLFLSLLEFTMMGMMIISATPNLQKIPKWWVWAYWICPVAWTFYGLIASQYGDKEDIITGSPMMDPPPTLKSYLEDYYGYKHSFLGPVAAVMVGMPVVLALLFAFFTKKLNFQTR